MVVQVALGKGVTIMFVFYFLLLFSLSGHWAHDPSGAEATQHFCSKSK